MTQPEIFELLERLGAVLRSTHVVYTSGKHGSVYINKDAIYPHTQKIAFLCAEIAAHFAKEAIEVVVAPAVGAIVLSQWVAHHLSRLTAREVLAVYADKTSDGFELRRGYDQLVRGKTSLIVEDVITTGGSVSQVVSEVIRKQGKIVGIGALCNRGGLNAKDFNVNSLFSLIEIVLDSWNPDECPLCKKGVPVNQNIGKGKPV